MKTEPITPAEIDFDTGGAPHSLRFRDSYHAFHGALPQARHVFLAGNGLPARCAGRDRFVIGEIGFGLGNNFLAAWDAWRQNPQRCAQLCFLSVEKHPPTRGDLARAHAASDLPALAQQLVAAWPPATPNLHPIDFEQGRVRLLLALGDVAALLPQLMASVDAFFLDGFAPDRNPAMWRPEVMKQLGRLAAPGASAATWSTARALRDGLVTAGFEVERAEGFATKRVMTTARHAPRHRPAPWPGGLHVHSGPREALVIGGGLAGCAAAWGLAREGWRVTVLDREAAPARATSGNAVGLFHGVVHPADGPHARLHRAAALRAARVLAPWIASGRVRGQIDGLLRLDECPPDGGAAAHATGHAEPVDRDAARALTGLPVPNGGWWFGEGGWVVPGDLALALLEDSGARFVGHTEVSRIERIDRQWLAFDREGQSCGDAPVLVLANALQIPTLLGATMAEALGPLSAVRGQVTGVPTAAWPHALVRPRVPVGGSGYLVPELDGLLWCGATSQPGDADGVVRTADHRHNLGQLAQLSGQPTLPDIDVANLRGRVGWRAVTPDRLPWVGAAPDLDGFATATRADRVRFVPRLRDADGGLHVLGALGSRGITWAVLCGELLASWVTGAPCPVEADLRDALDPARRLVAVRRAAAKAAV